MYTIHMTAMCPSFRTSCRRLPQKYKTYAEAKQAVLELLQPYKSIKLKALWHSSRSRGVVYRGKMIATTYQIVEG
jgi:hypothetical protein